MKAVQSLWLGAQAGHDQSLPCWQLSNHYLRQRFDSVELWADDAAATWLLDAGLKFDAVHELPAPPEGLEGVWSIGKLIAASRQHGPFLHVDGDVFWRQPAPTDAPFLVQHAEMEKPAASWWQSVGFAPVAMSANPISYNFGIFGGTAWREIAEACCEALDCLSAHRALIAGCRCGFLTILVEQVWVPALLAAKGITPTCLLRHDHLQSDAARLNYFHAMNGKGDPDLMARIAARHRVDMPSAA